tara:strand:- start:33 stop:164 length:132 start_codon:yes stop_codon:yes gene_type:complete
MMRRVERIPIDMRKDTALLDIDGMKVNNNAFNEVLDLSSNHSG